MVREFADKVFTKADEVCVAIWQYTCLFAYWICQWVADIAT